MASNLEKYPRARPRIRTMPYGAFARTRDSWWRRHLVTGGCGGCAGLRFLCLGMISRSISRSVKHMKSPNHPQKSRTKIEKITCCKPTRFGGAIMEFGGSGRALWPLRVADSTHGRLKETGTGFWTNKFPHPRRQRQRRRRRRFGDIIERRRERRARGSSRARDRADRSDRLLLANSSLALHHPG